MTGSTRFQGAALGVVLLTAAAPVPVSAGALEQVVPDTIRLLYEEGTHLEFGAIYGRPEQSGSGVTLPPNPSVPPGFYPGNTGQIFNSSTSFSGAYKTDLSDRVSFLLGFDEPYAGNTTYGAGSFPFPVYTGTDATMETFQVTGALSYDVSDNVKIYGGLRAQSFDAESNVSFFDYTVDADKEWGYGYLVGAAYEKPEIALRVALTYHSSIDYDLATTETVGGASFDTTTDVETPQSLKLDFQTGIAPKTLVFGYIRWVDWTEFNVTPPVFGDITAGALGVSLPLVAYYDDIWTYNIGIGRQFTDRLAGAFSLTYEPETGEEAPTLAPYDGQLLATVALSYDIEDWNITGGVTYGMLGDAENGFDTDFNDGSVWGAGMRVSFNF